jgi:hypothetical protein
MRTALMLLGACLALAGCDVTANRPVQVVPAGGASAAPSQAGVAADATTSPTGVPGGKGQPSPSASNPATPTATSTGVAPPPTAAPPPTPAPAAFNDHDADNVNGGFDPGQSDGDGNG